MVSSGHDGLVTMASRPSAVVVTKADHDSWLTQIGAFLTTPSIARTPILTRYENLPHYIEPALKD